jgi:type I restriction enzyme, R subunit
VKTPKEVDFETSIITYLTEHGGYQLAKNGLAQDPPRDFKPEWGLDTAELFTFVGATQAAEWSKIIGLEGGDPNLAQRRFCERLVKVLDDRGTVEVLRSGVEYLGIPIKVAYFRRTG